METLSKNRLFQEGQRLAAVQTLLYQALPDAALAAHCQVAGWQNGGLKILVDSATWATQLRFQIPQLLENLKLHLPALKLIECRVVPQTPPPETIYWQAEPISREAAAMICDIAEGIGDEKLRGALLRLGKSRLG